MQTSIDRPTPDYADRRENAPTGAPRLRSVADNRFPRICSCDCNQSIPDGPI